jgi:ubiquinone/menaquinone biosynthesis C-methylase UbiE
MQINWSGERLETFVFTENTIEHLHRYALAIKLCNGKIVLDIASGEGYGSNILSEYADQVIGVDIDQNAVELANQKYGKENLLFKIGKADQIPILSHSIDVVVSFETLEHHDKHEEMMIEIKRVLKKDGILIISTPEKKYYSDEPNIKNPFHVKELYLDQFRFLIDSYFLNSTYYFQKMIRGSLILPELEFENFSSFEGDYQKIHEENAINPIYIIAIASDVSFIKLGLTVFTSTAVAQKESDDKNKELELIKLNIKEDTLSYIKNSWSYRIGNFIVHPFKVLWTLIR